MGHIAQKSDDPGVGHDPGHVFFVALVYRVVEGATFVAEASDVTTTAGQSENDVNDDVERDDERAEQGEGDEAVRVRVDGRVVESTHRRVWQQKETWWQREYSFVSCVVCVEELTIARRHI